MLLSLVSVIPAFSALSAVSMSLPYLQQPLARESLCGFIRSLYIDLGGLGCCVESPLVENSTCYTSTNLLAEYVLREVCGDRALAERIRAFLERYSTGFYNYYQVILGLSIGDPVYSIEEVVADNVPVGEKTVVVKHVRIGDRILGDWYLYGDRLVYDALASLYRGHRERALEDLRRLENLTDQYGVRDMVQKIKGLYETYKLALAVVLYRALGDERGDERYIEKLYSINPFTTLYRDGFRGEGDLNLETAALTAIALHTTPRPPGQAQMLLMTLATVIVATGAALATAIALRRRKSRHSL